MYFIEICFTRYPITCYRSKSMQIYFLFDWPAFLEDAMRVRDFSGEILEYKNDPVTGKQVLVWKAECGSNTRQGDPKAHTTENERC